MFKLAQRVGEPCVAPDSKRKLAAVNAKTPSEFLGRGLKLLELAQNLYTRFKAIVKRFFLLFRKSDSPKSRTLPSNNAPSDRCDRS